MKQRFTEIEGMRGVLSIIIVLYHFGLTTLVSKATGGLIEKSYWGNAVDFFFIISGFVLAYAQCRNPKTWPAFTLSRFFRLLPSYLALFVLFLPLTLAGNPEPLDLILSPLGIAYPAGLSQWNAASWSMSVELYLPIIFAPVFLFIRRSKSLNFIVFFLCFLGCTYLLSENSFSHLPYGVIRGLLGIGLGLSLFFIVRSYPFMATAFFGKWTSIIFFTLYLIATALSDVLHPLGAAVPCLAVIAIASSTHSRSALSSPIMVFLGSITFTLYLVHMPLQSAAILLLGNDVVDGNLPLKAGLIFASIGLAWVTTKYVEGPFNRFGHQLANRPGHLSKP